MSHVRAAYPGFSRRQGQRMNDRNQAREWDEAARHLVGAHGADPDRLLSLGLHLNHLNWVHFDTRAALEIAGLQPPNGHVHRELPDPDLDAPAEGLRPVNRAPSAVSSAANYNARLYADHNYTGLPQTGMCPPHDAGDVTGRWASMAVEALGEHFAAGCPTTNYAVSGSPAARAVREHFGQLNVTADQAIAGFRAWIRCHADAVKLRLRARSDFPTGAGRPAARRSSGVRTQRQRIPRRPVRGR